MRGKGVQGGKEVYKGDMKRQNQVNAWAKPVRGVKRYNVTYR